MAQANSAGNPPVAIGGFTYEYDPKTRAHLFGCDAAKCVSSSKVSYVLYAPVRDPNFEEFKQNQTKVVEVLNSRSTNGSKTLVEGFEQSHYDLVTTFTGYRRTGFQSGSTLITKTTILYSDWVTVYLISSSHNKDAADLNSDLFLAGLVTWITATKEKS